MRRWSLDELPQLINVAVGETSLVGPRPLIPEEANLIDSHYRGATRGAKKARGTIRPRVD